VTFTGREWNPISNLYFNRARYNNPKSGAFITEDSKRSNNLYPYTMNNPIMFIDPFGLEEQDSGWGSKIKNFFKAGLFTEFPTTPYIDRVNNWINKETDESWAYAKDSDNPWYWFQEIMLNYISWV